MLVDTHTHLGFFRDSLAAAQELSAAGVGALCATVEPAEYECLAAAGVGKVAGIELGVGLHPWWVADGTCDGAAIEHAAELAAQQRLVSEVGLDFADGREEQGEAQIAAFERMLEACGNGGHILSIHAVNAAGEVLRLLSAHKTCANNIVIFHWFSGSSYELLQARKVGCYFSVGPRMLKSKRGRSYAQQIELGQLLLETDMPANSRDGLIIKPASLASELKDAVDVLVELRADLVDSANAIAHIADNTRKILG